MIAIEVVVVVEVKYLGFNMPSEDTSSCDSNDCSSTSTCICSGNS